MTTADVLADLARIADSSPSPEAALAAWTSEVADDRSPLRAVRRRLALGLEVAVALEPLRPWFGADLDRLNASVVLARDLGCPFAPLVRGLAGTVSERTRRHAAGAAAAGAARASARMMAGLPVLLFPLGLLGGAPVLDALGTATILLACALGLAGWRWVERMIPAPPADDAAITLATLLAAALESGAGLEQSCDAAARDPAFERTRRRAALGLSWPAALAMDADPAVAQLGRMLERCAFWGAAAARDLNAFAEGRRALLDHAFDLALRRAPVRMVAPLVTCALPAFCLVTVVPLLRSVGTST